MVNAIILAAGSGSRMNIGYNKQYICLNGKEVLAYTLEAFQKNDKVDNIILVSSSKEIDFCKENIVEKYNFTKVSRIVSGGETRQNSVYNGLKACKGSEIVIIHDGARPFVKKEFINESILKAKEFGASTVAVKVKDTIKTGEDNIFKSTLNRDNLYSVQTPQAFKYDLILKAHENAVKNNLNGTDDSSLVEFLEGKVYIVNGDYFNIKITTKEDIYIGEAIIKAMKEGM